MGVFGQVDVYPILNRADLWGLCCPIRVLHRHGKSIREIARETGVARNAVRRYLRDEEAARYKPRPPRLGKLDPFKPYVIERLRAATPEWIPATVLLTELRERGYCGGYTMLKKFMASHKPTAAAEPVIRFETGPGDQQVDWAVIRRGDNRLSVFVATLAWSRAAYVEFVTDERVETLIEAHENAFFAFGGVPREVLYDNMRTVVLERHGYGRGRHRFHPGFLDFARHCGFRPRLCAPYRARTKGKVERFIRYLRHSFYVPLASRLAQEGLIVDRDTANLAVGRWLREVANLRVHGTTGAIPAERLAGERLQPVPMLYGGRSVRALQNPKPVPIVGLQHPLSVYDAFAGGIR
jgi:transposase